MAPPITRSNSPTRPSATASGSRPGPETTGSGPRHRSAAAATASPLSTARSAPLVTPPRAASPGARSRPTDPATVALHATRDRVAYFLNTAESLPSADYGPRAADRLRGAFRGDAVPTADDVQQLVDRRLLSGEQALRYFACATEFHSGNEAMAAAHQCNEMAASVLASIPPQRRQERIRVIDDLRALHGRLPDIRQREWLEPILLHARPFIEASNAEALHEAREDWLHTTAIYDRVDSVRNQLYLAPPTEASEPGSPVEASQASHDEGVAWAGTRDTPVDEIRGRILDAQGRLLPDRLVEEMGTSSAVSMFHALNSVSWAGGLMKADHRDLSPVLARFASHGYHGFQPGQPLTEEAASEVVMSIVAFLKTFAPYMDKTVRQGGMPLMATYDGLVRKLGADGGVIQPPGGGTLMLFDPEPSVGHWQIAPHESVHAHESATSFKSAKARPPKEREAVTEATADFVAKMVDGQVGSYEDRLKVTAMMGAVLEEMRKSLGVELDSDVIALDTLLCAHFRDDQEAMDHVAHAWDKVLKAPEYRPVTPPPPQQQPAPRGALVAVAGLAVIAAAVKIYQASAGT